MFPSACNLFDNASFEVSRSRRLAAAARQVSPINGGRPKQRNKENDEKTIDQTARPCLSSNGNCLLFVAREE